jgi:hypothetical protein
MSYMQNYRSVASNYREVVFISVIAEHMVQLLNLSYRFGNLEPEEDHVQHRRCYAPEVPNQHPKIVQ